MKLGKHDDPKPKDAEVKPQPEPVKPEPRQESRAVKDPWAEHCPRCGLLGCRKGHT